MEIITDERKLFNAAKSRMRKAEIHKIDKYENMPLGGVEQRFDRETEHLKFKKTSKTRLSLNNQTCRAINKA